MNKKVSKSFETFFNSSLVFGIERMGEKLKEEQPNYPNVNITDYFAQNISFELEKEKRAGMKKFLELSRKLELIEYK